MTRSLVILGLVMMVLLPLRAAGPDDLYLDIYSSLQQADTLNQNGQFRAAAEKYKEVDEALKKFQASYPNWNPPIVKYRSGYVTERVASLAKFLQPVETNPAANFVVSSGRTAGPAADSDAQVRALADEVRRLESARANLEAKLREALAVRQEPANDPELTKAQDQIASLQKERDLLRVALDQARTAKPEETSSSVADAKTIKQLKEDKEDLQRQLNAALKQQALSETRYKDEIKLSQAKIKELEKLERERAEVESKLRELLDEANRVADGTVSKSDIRKLRKLEEEKAEVQSKFEKASNELIVLQTQREAEIIAYQSALGRIKELEKERENLQKRLAGVDTISIEEKTKITAENVQLRSRLEAYEARPIPFTPEELALFKKPEEPSTPKSFVVASKMAKDLPAKSRAVLAEADKAFAAAKFEEAAAKYEEVASKDSKNVYTLANLASAKLELNRMDEAEETLKKALATDANDAFSLLLLGKIKMGQEKYDEALDALSRSSQLNPQSAETFNYLGIVLSEKGQRVSAEAALRKAIQIQPDYASAHHNLAIIYATQKPPFLELARWHYDKAVTLGHAANPQLEQLMVKK